MQPGEAITRVLKEDPGRSVWVSCVPGESARTIKSWTMTPWLACKCLLGIAQPLRHRRGTRRLRGVGISTPEVTSMKLGWRRGRPVVLLEMPFIEGHTALDQLQEAWPPDVMDLAGKLGRITGELAAAGLRHRDLKLSNVVVEERSRDIWLIDPVGVVAGKDFVKSLACMLERLDVEIRIGFTGNVPQLSSLRRVTLRAAIRSLERDHRRAVLQQLRAHLQA